MINPQIAAKYATERGFKFVKLAPNGKNPVEKDWPNKGVSDVQIIAKWAKTNNNIGALCGKQSGITVMDIDDLNAIERVKAKYGELPRTLTQRTPSGGNHLIFRYVEGIKNEVGVNFEDEKIKIDFRNDRGQAVFAGSVVDGKKYAIIDDSPIAEMPQWLKNLALKQSGVAVADDKADEGIDTSDIDTVMYENAGLPDSEIKHRPMRGGIDAGAKTLIDGKLAEMQGAIVGTRRDTLNSACLTIGGLIGANRIKHDEGLRIVEQLKQIAIGKGLPIAEAEKTARGGVEDGIKKSEAMKSRPMPPSTPATATTPASTDDKNIQIDVTQTIDLSSFAATDYDNAKAFVLLYPDKYRYNPKVGWLRYDEKKGIWRRDNAEPLLAQDVADMLEKRQIDAVKARKNDIVAFCRPNSGRIASTRTLLESLCYFELEEFDKHKDHVCATNCVINLRNGKQLPHSPHWGFTASVTAALNPDANDYLINDFLMQAVRGGEAVVKWSQKTGGDWLTGERRTEAATFLWGPSRAGKGSYAEAVKTLFGDLCHTLSFSALVEKRDPDSNNFDLAPLRGARLVIADESNRKDRLNGGKLKAMTGGNHIHCAFKGKDFFDYQPQFKIMMISNWPPNCDPDDDAAWGRLRVVEFPNSHLGSEDVTIKTRLKTREYQEALLKWLVLGAMAMYAENDGHIPPVPQIVTSTNEARNALDTIAQWLDQCTTKSDDLYTESSKLYQNYAQWAENMGYEAKSSRNLMQTLRAKGYDTSAQKWAEGRNLRVTTGLGLLFS